MRLALPRPGYKSISGWFAAAALACLLVADLHVAALHPLGEFERLLGGLIRPDLRSVALTSVVYTVAFAVLGVGLGAVAGLLLAIPFARSRTVRLACAAIRSVHELFWALLLLQVFGLSATTGILAIALPYAGICAKVYAEIVEEADLAALGVLPPGTGAVSAFLYARLPDVVGRVADYTLYRLECGLRSSLVLGFIGLPTMGFYLESEFRQGRYAQAGALLLVFYALIGSRRLWVRSWSVPILVAAAACLALPPAVSSVDAGANLVGFLTHDIVPSPLRAGAPEPTTWARFWAWLHPILTGQVVPGTAQTFVLAQIALAATAFGALLLFPLTARRFAGPLGRPFGRVVLVVVRSTPEYMLAYVCLQLLGPSMLPAIIALSLHNAGIIAYLMGRHADALAYRADAPRGLDLYAYETVPRLYGQFLAYLLYRWELILRESAIVGFLGVATLGFYVDAAISEMRFDAAVVLVAAVAGTTMVLDAVSRSLRRALRIDDLATRLADGPAATSPAPPWGR